MNQSKAWLCAVILGTLAVLISGGLFVAVLYFTGIIFGVLTIGCGVLSGFGSALGFKLGKGSLQTDKQVSAFLNLATGFGLLGVLSGYAVILGAGYLANDPNPWLAFDLYDLLFVALGAYGGRFAGEKYLMMLSSKIIAQEIAKEGVVQSIDSKFSQ